MKLSKSIIMIVLLAILGIAAGAGLKVYTILHTKSEDILGTIESSIDSGSAQYAALKEQGRFNILIMGEDDREGSRRSDTVLFATIDIDDKNMRISSSQEIHVYRYPDTVYRSLTTRSLTEALICLRPSLKIFRQPILYYNNRLCKFSCGSRYTGRGRDRRPEKDAVC